MTRNKNVLIFGHWDNLKLRRLQENTALITLSSFKLSIATIGSPVGPIPGCIALTENMPKKTWEVFNNLSLRFRYQFQVIKKKLVPCSKTGSGSVKNGFLRVLGLVRNPRPHDYSMFTLIARPWRGCVPSGACKKNNRLTLVHLHSAHLISHTQRGLVIWVTRQCRSTYINQMLYVFLHYDCTVSTSARLSPS